MSYHEGYIAPGTLDAMVRHVMADLTARAADPIGGDFPEWSTKIGTPLRGYGQPSRFEAPVQRYVQKAFGDLAPGTGGARAPIERLEGVITPNGLHFDRSHNGAPDIDPAKHRLLIHGLVKKPLTFSIADLLRYPMVSRMHFIECSGNSGSNLAPQPPQVPALAQQRPLCPCVRACSRAPPAR